MKNWKRLLRSLPREAEGLLRGLSSNVPRRSLGEDGSLIFWPFCQCAATWNSESTALYGVEARALNQAVKRNLARFPDDFMFQLTPAEADEVTRLVSQSVTPAPGGSSNSSQIVMSSPFDKRIFFDTLLCG
jgi:hypothetical protein